MKKKITNKEIEKRILEMLERTKGAMNVTEIKTKLKELYNLDYSSQVIVRHLEILKQKGELEEVKEKNGEKI